MIARPSLLIIANSFAGAAFGYVTLFAMARFMGEELVGARAYALSLVFLLGLVTRLGFPTTHARRLARGDDVAGSNGTYAFIKMALTAAFLVLAAVAAWIWFGILDRPATDLTTQAIWAGIWIVVVRSAFDLFVNTFRGLERIVEREACLFANTLTIAVCTLMAGTAYAWSHGRWSPVPGVSQAVSDLLGVAGPVSFGQGLSWLMTAYLAGHIATLGLAVWLFVRGDIPVARPSRTIAADYWKATLPIMLVTITAVLMRRTDLVMIGFWQDNAQVGYYAGANKLSELVLVIATGIHVILLPVISRLQKAGKMDQVGTIVLLSERWVGLVAWPLVLAGILAATPIMHVVLSDHFLPAAPLFSLLLVNALIMSVTYPLRTKALGLGEQGFAARVAVEALVVNIVLNVVLIPDALGPLPAAGLGALGATWATLAATAVFFFRYRDKARGWTGHPYISGHMAKQALAGVATFGIVWASRDSLPAVLRYYDLVWFGMYVVLVYGVLLVLLRELTRKDIAEIRAIFSMRTDKNSPPVDES